MKINAVRLFLLILVLFLYTVSPSLADKITYTHNIDPDEPTVGETVHDYVDSSWADGNNKNGYMVFKYSKTNIPGTVWTDYVDYSGGDFEEEVFDYFSTFEYATEGTWYIYYEEFDNRPGVGESIGGGTGSDKVSFTAITAPEFSSYSFIIILLSFTYFIFRKKLYNTITCK
ncbi:MAG: hypothetical protein KAT48_14010 [Bacteroidales bacterium]|nr:hypothetical protein [Bacteroidales bacterium]